MDLTPETLLALAANFPTMSAGERKKAIAALNQLIPEYAKRHYWFYVWLTNKPLWQPGKFHLYLCNEVQKFIEEDTGHPYDILLIHTPPQHGKSLTVTETLPSWLMCKSPNSKGMVISYTDDTALRFTKANKNKIEEYGQKLFGAVFDKDLNRADEYKLAESSGYTISRGIGGSITSYTADWMLIDDPVKSSAQADSELNRQRANLEWNMTLRTRLKPGAKVIIIMTRWHELDLGGYIQQIEDPAVVRVINLPCEAEENDPLDRPIGAALAPEIGRGDAWLAQFKKGFMTDEGTRAWNAMYQCRPTSQEGNMLKRHWWRYWQPKDTNYPPVSVKMPDGSYESIPAIPLPDWMDEEVQSWDCTFKDTKGTDKVSGGMWSRNGAMLFLRDHVKDRMDIVRTMGEIYRMTARWPNALEKLIEEKANGAAVIQMMRDKVFGLIAVTPLGSKESRVSSVMPAIQAGNVYLPHPQHAPWVHDFIEECAAFPNGAHDDDVDMMSQALTRLIHRRRSRDPANKRPPDNSPEAWARQHLERVEKRYRQGGRETDCV